MMAKNCFLVSTNLNCQIFDSSLFWQVFVFVLVPQQLVPVGFSPSHTHPQVMPGHVTVQLAHNEWQWLLHSFENSKSETGK